MITRAGSDPKVAGLVYIAAFAPDRGESVATLIANPPPRHWSAFNLQLSEQFVRKWVPNPIVLAGRHICRDSQWGPVLVSFVAQLAPAFVVD